VKGHSLERSKGFPKTQTLATRGEDDGLMGGGANHLYLQLLRAKLN
jgi:hypothetical protein